MRPRILIVDDHAVMREGIRTLLGTLRPEWEICGEAADGQQAIESIKAMKPDVVILDFTMPVMGGLEAASRIRKLGLKCRILMFTMHESETVKAEIAKAGGHGYVRKSQPGPDLVAAIDGLLNGTAPGFTRSRRGGNPGSRAKQAAEK